MTDIRGERMIKKHPLLDCNNLITHPHECNCVSDNIFEHKFNQLVADLEYEQEAMTKEYKQAKKEKTSEEHILAIQLGYLNFIISEIITGDIHNE